MGKKTVIIGGVAGGATTAARLRRRDAQRQIVMFEKGEYISYANCGLPYYIGDVIKSRDSLLLQTPEAMRSKFNIDVRTSCEVVAIDTQKQSVSVKNLKTGEQFEESYDDLVIATGSSPLKPAIPGIDGENIFTLWTVPETDMIKKYLAEKKPRTAAVIGGGFIGLEMAENLRHAGVTVALVESQKQVMMPVDFEMSQLLHENIRMNDVELILENGVTSFENRDGRVLISLADGQRIVADMVLLAIGVRPNSSLAKQAGIALNERGGIKTDKHMRTSAEHVYAVGDVVEVDNFISKEKTMIPLAGPANKQARICADNIAGDNKTYNGSLGTAVAQVFDLNVASTGLNEKQLNAAGKIKNQDYFTALINQKSHAGYYPGATQLTLKMIFDKEGHILGGQIVGQDGVDKRIDTLATTIRLGGTIYDLQELELAYAPPFSSAKDPVNMLGFVAENILRGMAAFVDASELEELQKDKEHVTVLDVTEDVENMVFSIPGAYHIPLGQLASRMSELDKNKTIITYCAVGVRSYNAARILLMNGFRDVRILEGGTAFYKSQYHMDKFQLRHFSKSVFGENGEVMSAPGAVTMTANTMYAAEAYKNASGTTFQTKPEELPVPEKMKEGFMKIDGTVKVIDCTGLQCPGPIMKVYEAITGMEEGAILQVSATDMGFANDVESWCRRTGNTFIKKERVGKENIVYIKKGTDTCKADGAPEAVGKLPDGKTIVVFSGDLDKVLASFIIANGAAAMGRKVTMFFTFWGLNALRKSEPVKVKKSFIENMFGMMMPRGTKKLKLSKMNMGGMGTVMMKKVMKDKNVDSLEALMKKGMDNGIKIVACTMSMDIMGIRPEELIDGVELAGVASYLGDAEESNVNLFV